MEQVQTSFIEEAPLQQAQSAEGVSVELNRYVFTVGDLIDPEKKRESKRHRWGGIELENDYKCFSITRGFIWRNMIVPMVRGYDLVDDQLKSDETSGTLINLISPQTAQYPFGAINQLYQVPVQPGQEIATLMFGKSELPRRGLVEIKALRGVQWVDFKNEGIQSFFFPEWEDYRRGKQMPVELAWTRARIAEAIKSTSDSRLKSIGEDMLQSCQKFFDWGQSKLKTETILVKSPPDPVTKYVHSYSPLAEQLFGILEIQRDDYLRQDISTLANDLSFTNAVTIDELKPVLEQINNTQAILTQILANQMGQEVKAPQNASEPQETAIEVQAERTVCTGTKASGEPCHLPAKEGTDRCGFHQEKTEESIEEIGTLDLEQ